MSTNIQSPFSPGSGVSNPVTITQGGTGQVTTPAASAALAGNWVPADNGLLAATSSMDAASSSSPVLTAGTVYLAKCYIRYAFTWTNVAYVVGTAGSGASTGSFVGLYNSAGTLLSGSADIGANLVSAAAYSTALTTPQALAAGTFVWVALVENLATTQPVMRTNAVASFATVNLGLTAATARAATGPTAQTSLPASITPASNTLTGTFIWFGGS